MRPTTTTLRAALAIRANRRNTIPPSTFSGFLLTNNADIPIGSDNDNNDDDFSISGIVLANKKEEEEE